MTTRYPDINIAGRHVLVIEDIVDTGMSLNCLISHLTDKKPASLKVCTLINRDVLRLIRIKLDYVGFEVSDGFLAGYGMDYSEKYRSMPFVAVLKPSHNFNPKASRNKNDCRVITGIPLWVSQSLSTTQSHRRN